ncbi:MAG: GNAT family N-acetyltransferase [candidate division Zixibacteria bacterium]|nr:GNAT family N-acetyltransferase [candidate division Zixibacteria bacterium]
MFENIRLETSRLVIRPLTVRDLPQFHALLRDKEVLQYLPEDVMSREEARGILSWLIGCYSKNTPERIIKFTVGVAQKENNELIGWCGFGPLEFDPSEIEIYYGLSRHYWGRGLATEAAGAMMHYAFERVGLKRLVAVVRPENRASVRVIEKLGLIYGKTVTGLPSDYAAYEGDFYYSLNRDQYRNPTGQRKPDWEGGY